VHVDAFQWGDASFLDRFEKEQDRFDKIFLADLVSCRLPNYSPGLFSHFYFCVYIYIYIFKISNHYAHEKLLWSCQKLLKSNGIAYVGILIHIYSLGE